MSQTLLCRWQLPLDSARSVGFPAPDSGLRISHSSELPGLAETTNKIVQIIKLIVYSRQEEQCHKEGD